MVNRKISPQPFTPEQPLPPTPSLSIENPNPTYVEEQQGNFPSDHLLTITPPPVTEEPIQVPSEIEFPLILSLADMEYLRFHLMISLHTSILEETLAKGREALQINDVKTAFDAFNTVLNQNWNLYLSYEAALSLGELYYIDKDYETAQDYLELAKNQNLSSDTQSKAATLLKRMPNILEIYEEPSGLNFDVIHRATGKTYSSVPDKREEKSSSFKRAMPNVFALSNLEPGSFPTKT